MPFGALFAFSIAIRPGLAGRDAEGGSGPSRIQLLGFRVRAEIADLNKREKELREQMLEP